MRSSIIIVVGVILARALLLWLAEVAAQRSAAKAKSQLRTALVAQVLRLGPTWIAGQGEGELTTLSTRGIDGLTPTSRSTFDARAGGDRTHHRRRGDPDPGCAGRDHRRSHAAVDPDLRDPGRQIHPVPRGPPVAHSGRAQRAFPGHRLGLPTLAVFGRAKAQAHNIRVIGDQYRVATMKVLRVSFLSSLVLELLCDSVRRDDRRVHRVALGRRQLQPEGRARGVDPRPLRVYLPPAPGRRELPRGRGRTRRCGQGSGHHPDRAGGGRDVDRYPRSGDRDDNRRPVDGRVPRQARSGPDQVSFLIQPGLTTAITGPSGCGKSTLLAVLLGFTAPSGGKVRVGDATWRSWIRILAPAGGLRSAVAPHLHHDPG